MPIVLCLARLARLARQVLLEPQDLVAQQVLLGRPVHPVRLERQAPQVQQARLVLQAQSVAARSTYY
ncbi:MAG: hypothetical protein K9J06_03140 [Flavobacteriales bacterium]|nr:hypothetical protein [Flavobacteriales bacterium]